MRAAALATATVLAASLAGAAPAHAADDVPVWSVSTAAANGALRVDATCAFGLVLPGRPNSFQVAGAATAPGAISTTVSCHVRSGDAITRTSPGPAVAFTVRELEESIDQYCVSAVATFPTGATVAAPLACVAP